METVAPWTLILYYLFLLVVLGTSLFSLMKKRSISSALVTAFIVITIPLVTIINSIGRSEGHNEWDHLLHSIQNGEVWAIYVGLGNLFSIVWLLIFFFSRKMKR
ncbi:hypothetical protein [Halobacillus litoralis]|uniref:Uncharacterized protein n=1 Tax=Halobacillus litoralis TaxID=45668 RepID=A0A410M9Y4_9BACI|nr:hypothetical protein [Halobacillus litoralis]QAS51507.1 hypothetical protein HLI_04365 [Halobacillus litoralis]